MSPLRQTLSTAAVLGALCASGTAIAADTSFHAAGYGYANFDAPLDGDAPGFTGVAFNPIFLWREGDRILVSNEVEIAESGDGLDIGLEYATVAIDLWGPTLVIGKFLTPTGQFISRLHPSWINRMPDFPLPYRVGVTPMSHTGASLQYAANLTANQKITGVAFLANGVPESEDGTPALMQTISDELPDSFSTGGRLGLFLLPQLELGGSAFWSPYGDHDYLLLGGDFAFTELQGVDIRGEVMRATWGGDEAFTGAWAQASWRLYQVDKLRFLEPVVRFGYADGSTFSGGDAHAASLDVGDVLPVSGAHGSSGVDLGEDPAFELCVGADLWLRNNVVAKLAYVHRVEVDEPMLRAQLAFGY